ncbi:hypothetical protein BPOR_0042g00060 [Botrytis porri]|uniref:Uncharacterized protein n=1 Tax=Botrytis porri TaxID=87229 RepID=A0A4Z1L2K1_9HELO|nr:hypothetical protein BPOR_0042g00060 [Botrytis porri]
MYNEKIGNHLHRVLPKYIIQCVTPSIVVIKNGITEVSGNLSKESGCVKDYDLLQSVTPDVSTRHDDQGSFLIDMLQDTPC